MKKQKILIVDDSKPMLCLLEAILGKKFKVFIAIDGFEAMTWLTEGNKPDLIICDMQMPYIDGLELITYLSKNAYYSSVPILVLSGADKEEVLKQCEHLQIVNYISKPFDPQELLEKVNAALINVKQSEKNRFLFI